MGRSTATASSRRARVFAIAAATLLGSAVLFLLPVHADVFGHRSYDCRAPVMRLLGTGSRRAWGTDTIVSMGAHPEVAVDRLPSAVCESRVWSRLRPAAVLGGLGCLLSFGALLQRALATSAQRRHAGAEADHASPGEPTGAPRFAYVPALDGVRGLAVLAVLAFHAGLPWARGGFLGVDAFFVLSGYLITSLLVTEWQARRSIDLGAFWSRRARRLLPALLLVLVAVAVFARALSDPERVSSLRLDMLATLGYSANWRFIYSHAGYFDALAAPSPLRHMWSLAVEEQFYLVWPPLALLVLTRLKSPRALFWITAAITALSVLVMLALYAPGSDPSRVYYGTDARAQTVLIGAALAALTPDRSWASAPGRRRLLVGAGVASALFVGWTWIFLDGQSTFLYRGGLTLIALCVAVVITVAVTTTGTVLGRVLAWPPLRATGRISYGLYLWHWPIFLLLNRSRSGLSGVGLLGARLLVTFAVAMVSFVLVERPIRRGALRYGWASLATPLAIAVTTAALLIGTAPPGNAAAVINLFTGTPIYTAVPADVHSVVVGDSVGLTLAFGIASHPGISLGSEARVACGIVRGRLRVRGESKTTCVGTDQIDQWRALVARDDPDVVAVLLGRWEVYDRQSAGRWTHIGQPEFDAYLAGRLERAVTTLSARRAHVVFLTAPYYKGLERPDGGRWPEDDPTRVDRFNQILREVAARHRGAVTVVDLGRILSPHGRYTMTIHDVVVRDNDGIHISHDGAAMVGRVLLPALSALGQEHRAGRLAAGPSP